MTSVSTWEFGRARRIVLPEPCYDTVVEHGRRKVAGRHLPGEPTLRRAFGLLAGVWDGPDTLRVMSVFPLAESARNDPGTAEEVDEIYDAHAVSTSTPRHDRGWVARPEDVLRAQSVSDEEGWLLFGHYHTHRVPWPEDPYRDSCTAFDTALAQDSGLWAFIVSLVDPGLPRVRAFYEGSLDREAHLGREPSPPATAAGHRPPDVVDV
ncbi:hypothetical protein [Streptomyces sp. NPDC048650]|uniref:hypothetical protein n=1 Tax=Streptomyces sp. NPDC048650 TaxID=3365583 RepID=UPI003713CB37